MAKTHHSLHFELLTFKKSFENMSSVALIDLENFALEELQARKTILKGTCAIFPGKIENPAVESYKRRTAWKPKSKCRNGILNGAS